MIKFRHRNCQKEFTPATFAYDLPPASLFEKMFRLGEEYITFPFGATLVHPKEKNYVKSIGRDYALKAVRGKTFKLINITIENKRQKFLLETTIDGKILRVSISTDLYNESYYSRLDWIDFYEDDYFNPFV